MKRFLFAILTSLLLILPVSAGTSVFGAIRPLYDANPQVAHNICTAFSVNQKMGYWVTASHCMGKDQLSIDGFDVYPVVVNKVTDTAVLVGPSAPDLQLGAQPQYGQVITIDGFPYGLPKLVISPGHVINPEMDSEIDQLGCSALYDAHTAPGNSGSPVLDRDNKVMGILQWGTQHGLNGGVCFKEFKKAVGKYFRQ